MKYIQDPETFELIPADRYYAVPKSGIEIIPDIAPYRSQIDGSLITSRSRHREHLKQHGCIEVGNDSSVTNPTYTPPGSPPGLKEAIAQSMEKYMSSQRRKTRR
mgnify:FL=1